MGNNPRYGNGHRRRQLRARVLAEEDTCHLCGGLVDKDLAPNLPGSPELDEIIPVSKGGSPYLRENVALSHRLCNVRKGDGTRAHAVIRPYRNPRTW